MSISRSCRGGAAGPLPFGSVAVSLLLAGFAMTALAGPNPGGGARPAKDLHVPMAGMEPRSCCSGQVALEIEVPLFERAGPAIVTQRVDLEFDAGLGCRIEQPLLRMSQPMRQHARYRNLRLMADRVDERGEPLLPPIALDMPVFDADGRPNPIPRSRLRQSIYVSAQTADGTPRSVSLAMRRGDNAREFRTHARSPTQLDVRACNGDTQRFTLTEKTKTWDLVTTHLDINPNTGLTPDRPAVVVVAPPSVEREVQVRRHTGGAGRGKRIDAPVFFSRIDQGQPNPARRARDGELVSFTVGSDVLVMAGNEEGSAGYTVKRVDIENQNFRLIRDGSGLQVQGWPAEGRNKPYVAVQVEPQCDPSVLEIDIKLPPSCPGDPRRPEAVAFDWESGSSTRVKRLDSPIALNRDAACVQRGRPTASIEGGYFFETTSDVRISAEQTVHGASSGDDDPLPRSRATLDLVPHAKRPWALVLIDGSQAMDRNTLFDVRDGLADSLRHGREASDGVPFAKLSVGFWTSLTPHVHSHLFDGEDLAAAGDWIAEALARTVSASSTSPNPQSVLRHLLENGLESGLEEGTAPDYVVYIAGDDEVYDPDALRGVRLSGSTRVHLVKLAADCGGSRTYERGSWIFECAQSDQVGTIVRGALSNACS